MRIRLSDLTEEQRRAICDGCGGSRTRIGVLRIPQWRSRETCEEHDLAYWIGGTSSDRAAADRELLNGMLRDAAGRPSWQQPWYRLQAWLYYANVCLWGWQFFHFGTQRTRADLL